MANVVLKINNEEVPLNRYVTSIITKINYAIVETLKDIDLDEIKTLKIKINLEDDNDF